jgi:urease accessory protein
MSFTPVLDNRLGAMRPATDMLRLEHIIGLATEPQFAELLHRLDHEGVVEFLTLTQADTQRHRLRVLTDRGTECAIALPRTEHLFNGAVLLLEERRAVVVRMQETQWLELQPRDAQAALQLGYFAGNMHWKVEFDGTTLRVALQGPLEGYLERLAPLLQDGRVIRAK